MNLNNLSRITDSGISDTPTLDRVRNYARMWSEDIEEIALRAYREAFGKEGVFIKESGHDYEHDDSDTYRFTIGHSADWKVRFDLLNKTVAFCNYDPKDKLFYEEEQYTYPLRGHNLDTVIRNGLFDATA